MSKKSQGSQKLASVLQSRMAQVAGGSSGIVAERGEIMDGKKLKLYSLPNDILSKSDYSVCSTIEKTASLKAGDQVLVIWTNDCEPVVIDKIKEASDT